MKGAQTSNYADRRHSAARLAGVISNERVDEAMRFEPLLVGGQEPKRFGRHQSSQINLPTAPSLPVLRKVELAPAKIAAARNN